MGLLNRTIKFAINQTLDMMGFTTSVTALAPDFHRMGEQAQQPSPSPAQSRSQAEGRFRGQVGRAIDYAREDGLMPSKDA